MNALLKKILLVKPNYKYFPIGIAHVISTLKQHQIEYDLIDLFYEPNPNIASLLRTRSYGAVATGGLLADFTFYRKLFRSVKEADADMPCILGGNITTDIKPEYLFRSMPVDYLVKGEAEITFPELLLKLNNGDELAGIDGIVYQEGYGDHRTIVKTNHRKLLDITEYNWMPSWDFLKSDLYGYRNMPVLTGRGCVGHCSFCSPTNRRFRGRPLDHILEEIEYLNSNYDFTHFVFINDVFFPDEESICQFCEAYKKIKPFKPWHCLLRMDVDPQVLYTMADAGCTLLTVGVESGSDTVLKNIRKDCTVDHARRFIHESVKAGIMIKGSFMMANYDENAEDIQKTVDLMLELNLYGPMALTINYNGTLNYYRALKRGLIHDEVAYMESLENLFGRSYYQVISDYKSGRVNYLNLSALPDDTLFHVVEKEMRRYNTLGSAIRNISITPQKEFGKYLLTGTCSYCNANLQLIQTINSPFYLLVTCPKCGANPLYFDLVCNESYQNYLSPVRKKIRNAHRLALLGSEHEIWYILTFDRFDIDYDSIIGIVAHSNMPNGYILTYPVLPIEEIIKLQADLLIIANEIPSDIVTKISQIDACSLPERICLSTPDSFQFRAALDLSLYLHAGELFRRMKTGEAFNHFMARLSKLDDTEFWKVMAAVDVIYENTLLGLELPAVERTDIDLKEPFLGTGWGTAHENIHGTHWRWIGPSGHASLYLRLILSRDYQLKSLIHAAKGDTQEHFNVQVNGQSVQNIDIHLEEDKNVYHNCVIPKELIEKGNGWVKIDYRLYAPREERQKKPKHSILGDVKCFALSRVICKPV